MSLLSRIKERCEILYTVMNFALLCLLISIVRFDNLKFHCDYILKLFRIFANNHIEKTYSTEILTQYS